MKIHPNALLLAAMTPVMAWSAWHPYDRATWWMEVAPVFLGFIALFTAQRKGWRFSNLALGCLGFHMILLLIGGHYTYALVPLGRWVGDLCGFARNHYDRLGHLAQGWVPAIICREIFVRSGVLAQRQWLAFCVVSFCLALSASYELVEWAAASISAEGSQAFLGTQGDAWDSQWDMFMAGIGSICALSLLSRTHDRSMLKLTFAA